jgi:hypothetical protein
MEQLPVQPFPTPQKAIKSVDMMIPALLGCMITFCLLLTGELS